MTADHRDRPRARVFLCGCGPLLAEAIDLDRVAHAVGGQPEVVDVQQHATLCSEEGRAWLADRLREQPNAPVVVAGCSPREHRTTFNEVCHAAGTNPYLLAMANIREQCAWVIADRDQATAKAIRITSAAVARSRALRPLEERSVDCNPDVLVVGAGVAGLTAAHTLAQADRTVVLVERAPAIGGRTALLGDVFPGMECGSCMLEPLLDAVLHDPKIELCTYSEVEEIKGTVGRYTVRVRRRARHVDPDACYGCHTCHAVCPVAVPREVDHGLSTRGAVYVPYTGALPHATLIDESSCLHFQGGDCTACVDACPFGNIDLEARDEVEEHQVGAVVIATGLEPAAAPPPKRPSLVISAMAFERMVNSAGPTEGALALPGKPEPRSIALVYCADGRGRAPVTPCSKICCMTFAKQIQQIRERLPDCKIVPFFWERCTGGKGFREFASWEPDKRLLPKQLGPKDRVTRITRKGREAIVHYKRGGRDASLAVDLAVIAPPLEGAPGGDLLAEALRLPRDSRHFVIEDHERLRAYRSRVSGVLVAGGARGPGDVQDASTQGAAAAGQALAALVPGRQLPVEPATAWVDAERCGSCRTCVVTCPFSAVEHDPELNAACVDELLCQGCGSCAAACPAGAIEARHYTDPQIEAEVKSFAIK